MIVLPPLRWWWRIDVMILLALAVFAGANLYEAVIERNPRGWMSGVVMVLLLWGAIKVARQRRAVVLDVTPEIFRTENVYPLVGSDSPVAVTRRYRRADVYDVRFVDHSGNLVIRIHGHELFECRPSSDPGLMRWIAEELRRALGLSA